MTYVLMCPSMSYLCPDFTHVKPMSTAILPVHFSRSTYVLLLLIPTQNKRTIAIIDSATHPSHNCRAKTAPAGAGAGRKPEILTHDDGHNLAVVVKFYRFFQVCVSQGVVGRKI